jgi:hypothetical protein
VAETRAISPMHRARLGALNRDVLHFPSPCQKCVGLVRGGRREKTGAEEEGRRDVEEKEIRYYVSCK